MWSPPGHTARHLTLNGRKSECHGGSRKWSTRRRRHQVEQKLLQTRRQWKQILRNICMHLCMYVCMSVCVCVSVCMYVCMDVWMHVCMYAWMDGCVCIMCMYIYIYISFYIYIYIVPRISRWSRNLQETPTIEYYIYRYINQIKPAKPHTVFLSHDVNGI